jgi:TolA-binding protein
LRRLIGSLCIATAALALAGPVRAQDGSAEQSSRDQLAKQIREKVEQLQSIRQQRALARQSHQQQLSTHQQQIDRLRGDLEAVQDKLDDLESTITQRQRELEKARQRRDRATALIDAAADAAGPVAERMQRRVKTGVPWQQQARQQRVGGAMSSLASDEPVTRAEGAMELLGFAGEELKRSATIELTNRPVVLEAGEKRKHAYVLRLGLAGAGFVSEDRSTVGLATMGGDEPWRLDLPRAQREKVIRAVATLRENEPPALIAVPFLQQPEPANAPGEETPANPGSAESAPPADASEGGE